MNLFKLEFCFIQGQELFHPFFFIILNLITFQLISLFLCELTFNKRNVLIRDRLPIKYESDLSFVVTGEFILWLGFSKALSLIIVNSSSVQRGNFKGIGKGEHLRPVESCGATI